MLLRANLVVVLATISTVFSPAQAVPYSSASSAELKKATATLDTFNSEIVALSYKLSSGLAHVDWAKPSAAAAVVTPILESLVADAEKAAASLASSSRTKRSPAVTRRQLDTLQAALGSAISTTLGEIISVLNIVGSVEGGALANLDPIITLVASLDPSTDSILATVGNLLAGVFQDIKGLGVSTILAELGLTSTAATLEGLGL